MGDTITKPYLQVPYYINHFDVTGAWLNITKKEFNL